MVRISRISLLGLIALAVAPSLRANNNYNSGSDSFFESGFEMFYAGPQWLLNALPGSVSDRVARARAARVPFDRDGDRVESLYRYANDIGTLGNPFNVMLFNNVATFATHGGTTKTTPAIIQDDNTPYLWTAIPGAAWDVAGNWSPNTGPTSYPNAPGDVAGNIMEISTSTIQNRTGGVTVGGINHAPFVVGGASSGETWTITANTSISMNSGVSGTDATISNSNPGGTFINNITIDGSAGLNLVSNVTISNLNTNGGLITISAPIVGPGGVTVVGPGTTIFSNSAPGAPNSFTGSTMVNSGTLQAATDHSLGSTSSVTVNAAGTLMFAGANATFDRINDAAPINLNGGTINTAGLSEYAAGVGSTVLPGMGALTLTSTATIDLGNLASIISFADSHNEMWTGSLRILNWTGTIGTGDGTDQVYFGTDSNGLSSTQLNQISFFSDDGTTLLGTAQILADGEIVPLAPVPEPATWIVGALALAAVGFTQRRKLRGLRQLL
jgi:autotransporter-associated beta strand protein